MFDDDYYGDDDVLAFFAGFDNDYYGDDGDV
jgi:hypothetical protein